jgi:hypothetical protein
MQQAAPFVQHRVVGDVIGQRVLEGVLDVADRRLLVDELAELEFGTASPTRLHEQVAL